MKRLAGALVFVLLAGIAPPEGVGAQDRLPRVVILTASGDPADSIRTILQRDLAYGDALRPVELAPAALRRLGAGTDAAPDFRASGEWPTDWVVVPRRGTDSLLVAVYDAASRKIVSEHAYAVPPVPPRLRVAVRDSLIRFYAVADSATRSRILAIARTRDSLLAVSRVQRLRSAADTAAAQWRALHLAALAREDSTMRAWIVQAAPERDSLIRAAARRDSVLHDSLSRVERWWIHTAADEIQLALTGKQGMAASRLAYVSDGRLHVVDSDGANRRVFFTPGRALSPTWHPSGRYVAFSELRDAGTQIAELDLVTGVITYLGATPRGYNLTPAYTPDGERIVFAAEFESGHRLISVERGPANQQPRVRPLAAATRDASGPTFSPDGERLAFVVPRAYSGRGSTARTRPAMVIANADGSGASLLVPRGADPAIARTSPEWSPDGERIAFTQQLRIWLLRVRDRTVRPVGDFFGSEDPAWAPDSRHIAFTLTQGPMREVWIVDIETGRSRRLTYTSDARLPAWSARIRPE